MLAFLLYSVLATLIITVLYAAMRAPLVDLSNIEEARTAHGQGVAS